MRLGGGGQNGGREGQRTGLKGEMTNLGGREWRCTKGPRRPGMGWGRELGG